jgi:hypothetical protein
MDFGNGRPPGNIQLCLLVITNDAPNFVRDLPGITFRPTVLAWLFTGFAGAYFYIDSLVGNGRLAAVHWLGRL